MTTHSLTAYSRKLYVVNKYFKHEYSANNDIPFILLSPNDIKDASAFKCISPKYAGA